MNPRKILAFCLASLASTLSFALPVLAADDIAVTATVDAYISITANYAAADWGNLDVSAGAVTDQDLSPASTDGQYNATIDTNKNFKLEANATDVTDGGTGVILVGNITVDSDTTAGSLAVGNGVAQTASPQTIDTGIALATVTHYHGMWLSAPQSQKAGSYSGTVTLTYSNV